MLSTQPDPFPHPHYTLYKCIACTYSHREGGRLTSERVRRALVHKRVEHTNMTDCLEALGFKAEENI
jgi:hypothetical protein